MEHTKEPWMDEYPNICGANPPHDRVIDCTYGLVGDEPGADCARIVACVNALAGIADPAAAVERARELLRGIVENAPTGNLGEYDPSNSGDVWADGYDTAHEVCANLAREALRALTPQPE